MTISPGGAGPELVILTGSFLALSTISIIARCYCRVFVLKSFGLDDWMAVAAWVSFSLLSGLIVTGVFHGLGRHITDIPPSEITLAFMWWWACEPTFVATSIFLKLSIGIMLLRLTVTKTHRIIIYVVLGVVVVYSSFFFLLFVLQCHPISYFWTRLVGGEGSCINPTVTITAMYIYSAVSCASDWTLAILPIFMIWTLQLNIRTKIVAGVLLSLGAFASTATIVRIPYISSLSNSSDFLYANRPAAIWSIIEMGVGIIACCLATLRPFFRTFFSRSHLLGGSADSTHSHQTNQQLQFRDTKQGYVRSEDTSIGEPLNLITDIRAVTTMVSTGGKDNLERGDLEEGRTRTRPLSNRLSWNESEDNLVSQETKEGWITKTVVSTTTTEYLPK